MPKNIKQRENYSHNVKSLDRERAFTSRVKKGMIEHYQKLKQEKSEDDIENSTSDNYAVSNVVTAGKIGSRETTYAITGISEKTYNKVKMKYNEKRIDNKVNQSNNIQNYNQISEMQKEGKAQAVKKYQKEKLIKEKHKYKDIKEHSYKDNGVKENNNTIKIRTRENSKQLNNTNINAEINRPSHNELMKKSTIQKTKEKATSIKEKTKKVGKVIVNSGKKVVQGIKGIGMLLGAGGGFVIFLVIIIIMIAGLIKSVFGIFFTNDTASTETSSMSVSTSIQKLDEQVDDKIEEIENNVSYDKVIVNENTIYWKNIIVVYSVMASNRDGIDVAIIDERAFNRLEEIFNEVVEVSYDTSTYYVTSVHTVNGEEVREREARTRLEINVNCKTLDEMLEMYNFTDDERKQALEILSEEYDEMWESLL